MIHKIQEYILPVTFTNYVLYFCISVCTNLKSCFHNLIHAYTYINVGLSYSMEGTLYKCRVIIQTFHLG
jgi:hypothetical protein